VSAFSVTIEGTYLGQVINNVLGIRGAGDVPAGAQAQDLATRVRDHWRDEVMTIVSGSYAMTGVNAVSMTNPEIAGFVAANNSGGSGTDPYSGAICAAVQIRTGLRGRAFRGRTGICGLTEDHVSGNSLAATALSSFQARIDGFRNRLLAPVAPATEVYELGVISRYKGTAADGTPVPRIGGPIFTPSIAVVVAPRVGTRVSRLR
jgi:hypothetical protein